MKPKWSKTVLSVLSIAVIGLLALGLTSTPAFAGSQTANLAVSATIVATCTINTTPVAFGNYSGTALTYSSGGVSVQCTNGTTYTIALNAGLGTGATVSARSMSGPGSPSAQLGYGLYTTSGLSTIWGDGTGSTVTAAGTGNGSSQSYTAYGQIPAGQYLAPGSYNDTVVATVTW